MYGSQFLYTSLIDTFKCTYPQFQIRINRVLNKYRNINTFQRIGKSLHGKRVCGCSCTYPKNIYTIFKSKFYVFWCSHLCCCKHACLLLNLFHPRQSLLSVAFKTSWFCSRLPYSCAEYLKTFVG